MCVGRRELGHGELAQRALAPVVPGPEQVLFVPIPLLDV